MNELYLQLQDEAWPFTYTDHHRQIARAIVFDENGKLYFVRASRDDAFGRATIIETSGGGLEPGENPEVAILRELQEELGVQGQIVCKLGVVEDYYNLIHRHNINHYYLCKALSFGETHMTQDEIETFHLSTLVLTYDEAVAEYEARSVTPLGSLLANRELPILRHAGSILKTL